MSQNFEEKREKTSTEPLLNLLNQIGGWPIIQPNWNSEKYNWEASFGYIRGVLGINSLISINVIPDLLNSSKNIIEVQYETNCYLQISFITTIIFNAISF